MDYEFFLVPFVVLRLEIGMPIPIFGGDLRILEMHAARK
jgi:hypothetical protein